LDRLATQGLNFCNAVSVCPVCTPYRAALMTGRFPTSTGMFLNDARLPTAELCMGEILKGAGYATAFIGKWHLDGGPRTWYIPPERRQGWDYWKACECTHDYTHSVYYGGTDSLEQSWPGYDAFAQTQDAQNYLTARASDGQPFALMVSFGPPHFPSGTAPTNYQALYPPGQLVLAPNVPAQLQAAVRADLQGYYGHCTALDDCVSNLLATLDATGLSSNTIVVFTADHGETMGSHGNNPEQKQVPWDESARVPFLLRLPTGEGTQGVTVKTPLTTPDILPTLLGLVEVPIPDRIEGSNLSGIVRNPTSAVDRAALYVGIAPFAILTGEAAANNREYRAIRTSRYTYVRDRNGPWLMYDDGVDPYQTNNLVNQPASMGVQARLDTELQAELTKRGDEFLDGQSYVRLWGFMDVPPGGSLPYYEGAPSQAPISDYDQWATSFNLSGVRTAETIYQYGVGANPTNSAVRGHVPTLVVSSNGLQYIYAKRRAANSSVVYTIEATDNLTFPNWTNDPADVVGVGVLDGEFNRVTNRISAGKSQQFIRLVVE
jgi:arylsulfatase A-like enzyme